MEGNSRTSQRYLSGRVKVTNNAGLSSDRHLYVGPSEVEPNLGFVGEKTLPASGTYYKLVTVPNGDVSVIPQAKLCGILNFLLRLITCSSGLAAPPAAISVKELKS